MFFLSLSVMGCGVTGLLNMNLDLYEDDTSMEFVGSNIPGVPEGDHVLNVIPEVVIRSDGTDLMDGNSLQVTGSIDYRLKDHDIPDQYRILWRGVRDNHFAPRTHIRLQDANGRNALIIRFENDDLIVLSEDAEDNPVPSFSTTAVHEISIELNMNGVKNDACYHFRRWRANLRTACARVAGSRLLKFAHHSDRVAQRR